MNSDMQDGVDSTNSLAGGMSKLDSITNKFGSSLTKALASGIIQGKSFDDVLKGLGEKMIDMSLKASFKPLENLAGGMLGNIGSLFSGGSGGGGILGSLGLDGSSSSDLFGAGNNSNVTVNMAVSTPDVESFQRSESQVSSALARAVSRGQRSL